MATLDLTAAQGTLLATIDTNLQNAFVSGITALPGPAVVIQPITGYTKLRAQDQQATRDALRTALAAFMAATGTGAGITTTISYIKSDFITIGTLTFTNGVLTAAT